MDRDGPFVQKAGGAFRLQFQECLKVSLEVREILLSGSCPVHQVLVVSGTALVKIEHVKINRATSSKIRSEDSFRFRNALSLLQALMISFDYSFLTRIVVGSIKQPSASN